MPGWASMKEARRGSSHLLDRLGLARTVKVVKEVVEVKKDDAVKKKLTYAEKLELQRIDKEMPKLEKKKEELLALMAQGGTDHHAMMERSIELERLVKELDAMTDRWLVLSERV